MEVWERKHLAKKNNLSLEEWLTGYREKLYMRCRQLRREKVLKDVFTDCGDVTVVYDSQDGEQRTRIVHSDKEIDRIEADLKSGGNNSQV